MFSRIDSHAQPAHGLRVKAVLNTIFVPSTSWKASGKDEETATIRAYLLAMPCREPILAVNNSANCTAEIKLLHGQEVGNFGKVINDNEDCIVASLRSLGTR